MRRLKWEAEAERRARTDEPKAGATLDQKEGWQATICAYVVKWICVHMYLYMDMYMWVCMCA